MSKTPSDATTDRDRTAVVLSDRPLPEKVDVLVLGSGSAGSKVATTCAEDGQTVAVIENRDFGGTCALRGCNPKKVLVRAAELVDYARTMRGKYLQEDDSVRLDWQAVQRYQDSFTEPIEPGKIESLRKAGVHIVRGQPHLENSHTAIVGDHQITFDRLVIATGGKPITPPFEGGELPLTSDDFLELESLPKSVIFLGGGYISSEFAHVAHIAGCEVTLIERGEHLLEGFDPDLVRMLEATSRSRGMTIYTLAEVESVAREGDSYRVTFETETGTKTIAAEMVVQGLGRGPAIDTLNLEAAGVEREKTGVSVDEQCRSVSQSHVWAIGDCAAHGHPMLTPTANETARCVARQLTGDADAQVDISPVPLAAFTIPPLGSVGMLEPEARETYGDDLTIKHESMAEWTTFRKVGAEAAAYKTLVQTSTGKIVGAHLLGPEAPELINLFAMAVKFGLTRHQMKSVLFTYPTLASEIRAMV